MSSAAASPSSSSLPPPGWSREHMARMVAADIPNGAYVNLGIGIPELVAGFVPAGREFILHTENGLLGVGPPPAPGQEDPELINAGKKPITAILGAAYFHHADSFAMIRGGHLDVSVLGAMQVACNGDLANWSTGQADAIPAVGGAMDLVAGVKSVLVMTEHTTRDGSPKLLRACSYPLTGVGVVSRIYTNLAVINITPAGFAVREMAPGLTAGELQRWTDAPLHFAATPTYPGT